jgi:predicted metal-dependent enzyme (double-stranded beta helix superfamily)
MRAAKPLLEKLIREPALVAHSKQWPDTIGQNLLLHEDDSGFVVNAVVRRPGRKGNVHDHAHAWVLYGVVDGHETLERFKRLDDGKTPGFAKVEMTGATTGGPGTVDIVPPFDIHAEQGGPARSVAMIVRSERLVGKVMQNGYDRVANTVKERSGPEQVPFRLTA